MRKIEPLIVDDPDRERILGNADQIVKDVNSYGPTVMMNREFQEWVLLALVTWKKIAEERQEHIDWHNHAWELEGYPGMKRG